jgi:hypothetical protein
MDLTAILSVIVYALFIAFFTFFGKVTLGNRVVTSISSKFLICVIGFPFIGLVFWIIGMIFMYGGKFILLPVKLLIMQLLS